MSKNYFVSDVSGKRLTKRCLEAERWIEHIRSALEKLLVDVRVEYPECNQAHTMHVMFDRGKERMLNWWPATGTINDGHGYKQVCCSTDEVLAKIEAGATPAKVFSNSQPGPWITGDLYDPSADDGTCPFEPGRFEEIDGVLVKIG